MTKSGAILGTVRYMAPEQAKGDSAAVSSASDIYSLGVILYQLLTGKTPFESASDIDILQRIIHDEPQKLRGRSHSIDRDLEIICFKCLEKDPKHRYASSRELAEDLERHLQGEIIHARSATLMERSWKWLRRHPLQASLALVIFAATTVLVISTLWYNARLRQAVAKSQASEHRALSHAYAADMRQMNRFWETSQPQRLRNLLDRYVPKDGENDLRGLDWWIFRKSLAIDEPGNRLGHHEGAVTSVAIHPSSHIAATGGHDGVLHIWNLPSGTRKQTIKGRAAVDALEFSPDGTLLASGCGDGNIQLWNVADFSLKTVLKLHTDWIAALAFSPDGTELASAGGDRNILLWNLVSGGPPKELLGHTDCVRSLIFDSQRPILYSSAEDGTVRVWDSIHGLPSSLASDGVFLAAKRWVTKLVIAPDNSKLACVFFNQSCDIYSISPNDFASKARSPDNPGNPRAGTFMSRGANRPPNLALGLEEGAIQVFRTISGFPLERILHGHNACVTELAASNDERVLLSGDASGEIILWDMLKQRTCVRDWDSAASQVEFCEIAPNGETVIYRRTPNVIGHVDFQSLRVIKEWDSPVEKSRTKRLIVVPSKNRLIELSLENNVVVHALDEGRVTSNYTLPRDLICIEPFPNGDILAVGLSQQLLLVKLETGEDVLTLPVPAMVKAIAFTQSGQIVLACRDGVLRWTDAKTGSILRSYSINSEGLSSVAISPHDDNLLVAGGFQSVFVVDTRSMRLIERLPVVHDVTVHFIHHGRELLTYGKVNGIQLWRTEDWQECAHLDFLGNLDRLSFSEDGDRIAFPHFKGDLRLVDAKPISEPVELNQK
ncbi:MAG: protein kinase [Planctomycetota bacterium]